MGKILVNVAMKEEAQPFLQVATIKSETPLNSIATLWELELNGKTFLLSKSGIGLCNATATITTVCERYDIDCVISTGSAGGMGKNVKIGDIICGTAYKYNEVDATIFGYKIGQIPQMPARYCADDRLVGVVEKFITEGQIGGVDSGSSKVWFGEIISGDSFITEKNIGLKRELYPDCLATDMETTAIAQTCYLLGKGFVSVRCVSDLCGAKTGEDFYLELDVVLERVANVVLGLVDGLGA